MVLTPIVRALAGRIKTLYPNSTDVLSILSKVLENGSDAVSARAPRIDRAQLEVKVGSETMLSGYPTGFGMTNVSAVSEARHALPASEPSQTLGLSMGRRLPRPNPEDAAELPG